MTPFPNPYHTLVGSDLTVYLNLVSDTDSGSTNITDSVLAQLASQWGPMATANSLSLTFAFSSTTRPPEKPIPPGINVVMGATPPGNIQFFTFTIGRGVNAVPLTRSARISYVTFPAANGYIYEMPPPPSTVEPAVPAISHELGHVLGLADRYYEAVYWLENWAINRTCGEIRNRAYLGGGNDFRDGVADSGSAFHQLPRLAVRVSLPMSTIMLPTDTSYNPMSNLMSTGTSALTAYQLNIIRLQSAEQTYRQTNWVAILADWERNATPPSATRLARITKLGGHSKNPDYPTSSNYSNNLSAWIFPAWEARQEDGGRGLLFLPIGHKTPHRYGCISSLGRGQSTNGDVVFATQLSVARGRTRVFAFGGTTYNVNGVNVIHPGWMCYVRQMISDLI